MFVKKELTLEDVLDYIGINYDGVTEEIEKCAETSHDWNDFFGSFHEYYSEHGLGGDDTWLDTKTYLPLVIKMTEEDEKLQARQIQIRHYYQEIDYITSSLDMLRREGYSEAYINARAQRIDLLKKKIAELED